MTDVNDLATRYIGIWNEPDSDRRAAAIGELFADDATYTDPLATVQGHEAVAALITGARDQFQGLRFHVLGAPDTHHNLTRFQWELVPEGGADSIVIGFDVVATDKDNKIEQVLGFLDKVPTA
ncbi:nuclear transport factor 2 family protein [Streptomyces sp. NPDC051569]|uniref:nuclear transport factor 2 family protein n=1 Tax=Streptomyces sp. NPDC051569 TaxID=3365661 RepID=UPI0037AE5F82